MLQFLRILFQFVNLLNSYLAQVQYQIDTQSIRFQLITIIIIIEKSYTKTMQFTLPPFQELKIQAEDPSLVTVDAQKSTNQTQAAKSSPWTQKELYLVASFFFYHSSKLISDSSRKRWKVFKIMSELVQSRNVNQCRSYTKKLFKTFKTVNNINSFFKDSLPRYKAIVHELKSANSNLYERCLSSVEDGQSQLEDVQRSCKVSYSQANYNDQQKKQQRPDGTNMYVQQNTNPLLAQSQERMWFNNPFWFLTHIEFMNWVSSVYYFNCIKELQ